MANACQGEGGGVNRVFLHEFRVRKTSFALSQNVLETVLSSRSDINVLSVSADADEGTVVVKTPWTDKSAGPLLRKVISSLGYSIVDNVPIKSRFLVQGMSCVSCASRIEFHVSRLRGVEKVSVNFASMTAVVVHDANVVTTTDVMNEISGMGYTVSIAMPPMSTQSSSADSVGCVERRLLVQGMSCVSCATNIESCVRRLSGVKDCVVNFPTNTCVVSLARENALESVEETITSMGYKVSVLVPESSMDAVFLNETRDVLERTREISEHKWRFRGAAVLAAPLAFFMILMVTTDRLDNAGTMMFVNLLQLCLSTPIVFHYGSVFFIRAWQGLKHRLLTMDTLVAIGAGCSYLYSLVACFVMILFGLHMDTYFDAAGMLLCFMLLGRYLEAQAKRSTSDALIDLMNLVPPVCIVITPQGDVTVPSSVVEKGMRVRVLAGDRIPVDGTVIEGVSDVDEQMLTGESVPKMVSPGSTVIGGTMNITEMMVIEANKIGEETMLSQILRVVQEAQNSKPAIQRIADHIAEYFVPFVIIFSLSVFFIWFLLGAVDAYPRAWRSHEESSFMFAFDFFIASIVAACPCALGLATPTAIMVGTGVGAKNGILVKSGRTLEVMCRSRCVVFDKTGTITNGRLEVVFNKCWGEKAEEAIKAVAFVEQLSNHPVAKAVASAILSTPQETMYEVIRCKTRSGLGAEAIIRCSTTSNQMKVHVGNLAMMRESNVDLSLDIEHTVREQTNMGRTTVIGAIDGVARIVVALADEPKDEAANVIQFLQEKWNFSVFLATGDNKCVAAHVASAVGIPQENVHAEALPTTKASIIQRLQSEGYRVIFVGDGINDSPALAQADVGIALGAGTEIAIEAADVVLVRNSLVDLVNLRRLSVATVHRVYGNFAWAFGYNFLMLPFASGIFYPLLHVKLPPIMAGAAMVLSSLSVLLYSLSIRCFTPYDVEMFLHGP